MPTKTRLDPTADGQSPSAGQDGALGSSPGNLSTSPASAAPPSGDVAGFIDSLTALASHLKDRERLEAEARRTWGLRAVMALLILIFLAITSLFVFAVLSSYGGYVSPTIPVAIALSGAATGLLAFSLYWRMYDRSLRLSSDSADRVALRHEDSPLRDRIRISQWILIDTALTRFAIGERTFQSRQVGGVLATAGWAAVSLWVILMGLLSLPSPYYGAGTGASPYEVLVLGSLSFFLILTMVSIVLTKRGALGDMARAQSLARQVLAFDADFGGFLPKVERERAERMANLRASPTSVGPSP